MRLFGGRVLCKWQDCTCGRTYCTCRPQAVTNPGDADLVTSQVAGDRHLAVIDIDVPARLEPSATPGHSHLYIEQPMSWDQLLGLLEALVTAGVVEPGYLSASRERGFTAVRVPWKPKGVTA